MTLIIKKLLNLIRSFKDYIVQFKNIHSSFMVPMSEIGILREKSISKLEKEIQYSENLFKRLRSNFLEEIYEAGGDWKTIYERNNINSLIKDLLKKDNKFFYEVIGKPHKNEIQWGFSTITKSLTSLTRYTDLYINETIYDCIFRVACSLGLCNLPEVYHKNNNNFSADELLEKIFNHLGVKTDFKNTFSEIRGIKTKYGLVSYHNIQQLYQAIKVLEITRKIKNPKVLEIGAGLGSTAYHSWNFGIKNYSIIDLPLGCISVGFNLSNLIGEDNLVFNNEIKNQTNKIKIYNPISLGTIDDNFDLMINFDSMTEMSKDQAEKYVDFASNKSKFFLSVNHESNSFTVNQIFKNSSFDKVSRNLTWYRQGYVEELFINRNL